MPYVRRGGLDVQPPPWRCDDIEGHVFFLDADVGVLQQLCDRCLNGPGAKSKLKYKPVLDYVSLTFQHFNGLRSTSPDCTQPTAFTYSEASFWVLVEDESRNVGPELLVPYMFLDNWVALAAGRETYGYPKEGAIVTMPLADSGAKYTVNTLAYVTAGSPATPTDILCVTNTGAVTIDLLDHKSTIDALINGGALNFVFLREIRAVVGGSNCDLQQVVRAEARPFRPTSFPRLLHGYQVAIQPMASHPIVTDLGLRVVGGLIDVRHAFSCKVCAEFQPGQIVVST